ncbi:MAG: fucose isomerase [Deltaproteobacteria bacterium]|nr:fucose isomerase [Candidatus Zymogenaceae bacterium]
MYLPLGTYSPQVKIGLVSASRDCFPRSLSEIRTGRLRTEAKKLGLDLFTPDGDSAVIESKAHARDAADQLNRAGCDGAVLFLGNFSPEIEDANFIRSFRGPVMIIAAAEESADTLPADRGDALCGMLSAVLAAKKRSLSCRIHIPERPIVDAETGAREIFEFEKIMRVYTGISGATLGLFGPRPRDFETCNYNLASLSSIGVEIEEHSFFDLVKEVKKAESDDLSDITASMKREVGEIPADLAGRLGAYERAVLNLREQLRLSAMTSQCWSEQEETLGHVPCYINARMAGLGFPIACENDAYSLTAELMGQYASDGSVTVLDLNHSIPTDFDTVTSHLPTEDLVGLFHCGNTALSRMKNPALKHQVIMKRLMEPEGDPDITRGTIEGQIAASPLTLLQVHGRGDRLCAYIIEGEFLDVDPKTFGSTGVAHIPGFGRFYRHVLLGRFHHHAAAAFDRVGGVLFDAMKLLGVETIHTPLPDGVPYPGENIFRR